MMKESGDAREAFLAGLVRRMAEGDQEAVAQLYDATAPQINGLILSMLHAPADAEEALLDVYTKAWKDASRYSPERGSVTEWLVTMGRQVAAEWLRRKAAARTPQEVAATSPFLRELSADQRETLLLAFFSASTPSEIARHLGQPLEVVKKHLNDAFQNLRDIMDGNS